MNISSAPNTLSASNTPLPPKLERFLARLASDPCGGIIGTVLIHSFVPFSGMFSSIMPAVNGLLGVSGRFGEAEACDSLAGDSSKSLPKEALIKADDADWRSLLLALEEREIWQQAAQFFELKLKEKS